MPAHTTELPRARARTALGRVCVLVTQPGHEDHGRTLRSARSASVPRKHLDSTASAASATAMPVKAPCLRCTAAFAKR